MEGSDDASVVTSVTGPRYGGVMEHKPSGERFVPVPRDRRDAVLASRRQPMARRLALALAWDELAAELRTGLRRARSRRQ
jgi:hypothetical protein